MMEYRREIDGLRALAVLPVILFHAGFQTFSGGFVGVDVFFVISGYLITTIILTELEQGKFSLVNFYERRARRILPALFLVMLVCIPFAWLWLLPSDMQSFAKSIIAVSLFSSNILFWRESGYFDTAAELKPLLHTWSLAVEEQYYMLFPLFLMMTWHFGKRWILGALAVVAVISLAAAQWGSVTMPAMAFFLLPTRGWELLVGAFAAFYLTKTNRADFDRSFSEVGGWLGLVLILYAIFSYSKTTPFPSLYALAPTIGTALIILFATQQTTVGKFIGNKAFVGVGLISYSAYLWHQPLFSFLRHSSFEENNYSYLILIFFTFILAFFTWKYIENFFRDRKKIRRSKIFFIFSLVGASFLSFGVIGYNTNISKHIDYEELNYSSHWIEWKDCNHGVFEQDADGGCKIVDPTKPVDIVVIGDSHAGHYASGFLQLSKKTGKNITIILRAGCYPGLNTTYDDIFNCKFNFIEKAFNYAANTESIKTVILSGYGMLKLSSNRLAGNNITEISNDRLTKFENGIYKSLNFFSSKSVIIIADNPEMPMRNIGKCLKFGNCLDLKIPREFYNERNSIYNKILYNAQRAYTNLKVVYPHDYLCDSKYCFAVKDGKLLYQSDDHLTPLGGRVLIQNMLEALF